MEESEFRNMMQHSKLEIQFPNFEETVMEKIRAKEASLRSVWKNLSISWIFFFIGTFTGLFATQFLAYIHVLFLGENSKLILLVGEILMVSVIGSQLDSLIRFTLKKKE
jgi:hypothetical protein